MNKIEIRQSLQRSDRLRLNSGSRIFSNRQAFLPLPQFFEPEVLFFEPNLELLWRSFLLSDLQRLFLDFEIPRERGCRSELAYSPLQEPIFEHLKPAPQPALLALRRSEHLHFL